MTQPQVHQLHIDDFLEDLQHSFNDPFDALIPTEPTVDLVVESSGPGIGNAEPDPIPANAFPTSDIY
jgi:hypothetical protein